MDDIIVDYVDDEVDMMMMMILMMIIVLMIIVMIIMMVVVVMMIPSRARSSEGRRGEDCGGETSSGECQGWESQQTIMLLILYCSLMSMLSPLFPRRAGRSRLDQPLLLQGAFTCIVSAILITLLPYHHHLCRPCQRKLSTREGIVKVLFSTKTSPGTRRALLEEVLG